MPALSIGWAVPPVTHRLSQLGLTTRDEKHTLIAFGMTLLLGISSSLPASISSLSSAKVRTRGSSSPLGCAVAVVDLDLVSGDAVAAGVEDRGRGDRCCRRDSSNAFASSRVIEFPVVL